MGQVCSSKKNINLIIQEKEECTNCKIQFPDSFKQETMYQKESNVEFLLKQIELIDTQHAFSEELLQNLNELIIRRSNILFLRNKQIKMINDHLNYCVLIIRRLQGNEEFEHYFPILSYCFYEECQKLEIYLRKQQNESTRYCSLQKIT